MLIKEKKKNLKLKKKTTITFFFLSFFEYQGIQPDSKAFILTVGKANLD